MDTEHNFKKKFGQNFLRKEKWAFEVIQASQVTEEDLVIEIGPGEGFLTDFLAQSAKKVIAVDIDKELSPIHQQLASHFDNLEFVYQDILDLDITELTNGKPYRLVGSLPYNISKPIIRKFLKLPTPPVSMTFIIQKEVAKKYVGRDKKTAFLTMFARISSDIEYITTIPKEDFYPQPKVDGGLIHFSNIRPRTADDIELNKFIKLGFSQPRKTLVNNLSNYDINKSDLISTVKARGLSEKVRAGELNLADWRYIQEHVSNQA